MKRIKEFSKFNEGEDNSKPEFRMPEEVSKEKFDEKYRTYGRVDFTDLEISFLKKFVEENGEANLIGNYFLISICDSHNRRRNIGIRKLDDNWYTIYDSSFTKFYICDEWEEVLGYLYSIV